MRGGSGLTLLTFGDGKPLLNRTYTYEPPVTSTQWPVT